MVLTAKDMMNIDFRGKKERAGDGAQRWENAPWLERESEEIKAARKSGDTDDPLDVLLYDPIAIRLARQFIRAGWSANAVTLLSLFFGVCGAILFYPQARWVNLIGIALVIFAAILDCCDGQIARLTHTSSQLGRVLDGMVDIANFFAIYIALGLRMTRETIPFTDTSWSGIIWIIIVVAMLCHASQARMADYYRGLHLFFLQGNDRAALARARQLRAELAALPKDSPFYRRMYRRLYLFYTEDQEKQTPRAQRLLAALEETEGDAAGARDVYLSESRRYIQITNALTFNLRSYVLYALLLLRLQAFYFPFVIVILEAVKWFMVSKYESIAKDVYERFFFGHDRLLSAGKSADRTDL